MSIKCPKCGAYFIEPHDEVKSDQLEKSWMECGVCNHKFNASYKKHQ